MKTRRRAATVLCLAAMSLGRAHAQEALGEAIVVSATREPNPAATSPFAIDVLAVEQIRRAPQLRLDDILRAEVPGFSLFRRSSSRVANPTTQGVTLRNFGPSGAGRTLVLVDGIPLNDPFAGYILWNQIPPSATQSVIVTPGGGAGLFGNAALAGTIFIDSRQAEETSADAQLLIGDHDTYSSDVFATLVEKAVTLSLSAERFSTGGYPVIQANQRGPVDNAASADSWLVKGSAKVSLGPDSSLAVQMRAFRDQRGNGTIYTENETRGRDFSAVFAKAFREQNAELRISGYAQERNFRSTFSSINTARTIETPALNQYNVPAVAAGGSMVFALAQNEQHSVTLGTDARWVKGATNESFRFVANSFTRDRKAGGEQSFLGVFAEDRWKLFETATVSGGVRLDRWQLNNGSRTERDLATGAITLRSNFPDRAAYDLNGRLGATADLAKTLSIRAASYTGFRVPTLNELYRPFRVGNVITEANPELQPEQLLGGEAGIEWRPAPALRLAGTFFYNRLQDSVGNVTVGFGPGTFGSAGFIPSGGVLRQRRNIDLVTAPGLELKGEWQMTPHVFIRTSYLFTRPTIERAAERVLIGKLLAQTPEHVVSGAIEWKPATSCLFTLQARYSTAQFEDDQNAIPLAPYFTVDAAAFYEFNERVSAGLKVENLLNSEVETGKAPDGLVSTGLPRMVSLQLGFRM
ncbi:MAG: TonB-dependent receptor [Verrucomicrobiota bacterium]|nr:TonB-dependent receptor [Verrucomicrobiota bacterium]